MTGRPLQRGLSLTEVLVALAISAVLYAAVTPLLTTTLQAADAVEARLELTTDTHYALQRMVDAVAQTTRVMIPQVDRPDTEHLENRREGIDALLAVALPHSHDRDADGFPDADNDRDGRVDEDPGEDLTNDGASGIAGFDDNGDGDVDPATGFGETPGDDDEYRNFENEDPVDGVDNDGDGNLDEDPGADLNGDGSPGVAGTDDDGDGQVDEGDAADDDEDGRSDEDWVDALLYYVEDNVLYEQRPSLTDRNNDGIVDGRDVERHALLERVRYLRFERRAGRGDVPLIDIELQVAPEGSGSEVHLTATVRGETRP
ncbi:MAG: prepilin-type N-terminal cleavage/methylation domain-containing protein [Pseudomonadota bacterium]